ncbi:hypothetical protein EN833_15100 [Mesorhizobium sp. M4B.F.Ca.ET.190.01.1.1]|uniref:hypothetical protein n=1 Tax=unclassified Mesorhizobium TaxID=325217 RepID=UPI001092E974|nr:MULTISPECIES: hypothetical protein [unclassified Mesorhizobium]TGR08788.1 hypothetical protein EN843_15095 [Mesorhizobium sp. M4B.F.Ca.ET.200.01.1.1]TGS18265.1 hypothetical protein EN833_15100 [Mesorhizobium sp. M4B.F.Ca.ET.190.01.1.1]TGT30078.1 hypothetical protein EN815_15080 [Mesorhizobium sp. M4B.F.Ca.ET.172.01.1.1]
MAAADERAYLKRQITEFTKEYRGRSLIETLEKDNISYRTWRRAANGESISDVEFRKISLFLSNFGFVEAPSEIGSYRKNEKSYGFYNLYRPNSIDENRIEIFSARMRWDGSRRSETVVIRDEGGEETEFIVQRPKSSDFFFLRGAVEGWSSLYVLRTLRPYPESNGQKEAIMGGLCVATDYTDRFQQALFPVVFPIVLEKGSETDFSEYRQAAAPSDEHARLLKLLQMAVHANEGSIGVWRRLEMPGKSNGGPQNSGPQLR